MFPTLLKFGKNTKNRKKSKDMVFIKIYDMNGHEKEKYKLTEDDYFEYFSIMEALCSNIEVEAKIAGKTGTAQVVGIPQSEKKRMKESELEYYHRSHAWFTTYGPYKNPQYIVTVMVEHGGHGGAASGDMISKIYDKLLEMGYIKNSP